MQIRVSGSGEIVISGNIKSIDDSQEIKNAMSTQQSKGAKSIHLNIQDSFSMTSTVIGHLMKLVNLDKISVAMVVGDERLYQLLDELNLIHPFNVRLAGK